MGTIADKLLYLKSTVDSMKQAFTDMGIEVGAGIPLRECVDRIRTIPSGRARSASLSRDLSSRSPRARCRND